jgi:membrane associated rhomboid family serine protease
MSLSISNLLILFSSGLSLLAFRDSRLMSRLVFNPYLCQSRGEWYRFLTSGFIHGDLLHLFVNMFVLYMFGNQVERFFLVFLPFPQFQFLLMYLLTIVLANLSTFYKHRNSDYYNSLGASGGVAGVVFSYVVFQPFELLYIYGIIPLPGILMAVLYLAYSTYMSRKGGGNINHDAHLWGAVVGTAYTIVQKPELITRFF